MTAPKVFVLILSYNGVKWLKGCLPTVLSMDYPNFETVVIDNGSSDETQAFLRENFPEVQVVALHPNRGYAGGFNAGLEYAAAHGADFFLVMNNDTEIHPHALTALVETAQSHDRAGFVTGKVYFHNRRDVFQSVGKTEHPITWIGPHIGYEEKDNGQYDQVAERVFVDDIYTLVHRQMYDEIGGYDPQFFLHCEEFDWQLRAKKAGWKIYYTPRAWLWHHGSVTTGGIGSPINSYFMERSRIIAIAKHGGFRRLSRYLLWSSSNSVYRLAGAAVQLNGRTFKPRLARLMGFGSGTAWLITRHPATHVPDIIRRLSG